PLRFLSPSFLSSSSLSPRLLSRFLFFYPSPPPRHLHSFPTRRSSDLALRSLNAQRHDKQRVAYQNQDRRLTMFQKCTISAILAADRKSTRLNSSHVEISYAVFCLKKKKK